MGYVPYVGFVTHHRATVRTCLCLYKKKKKKKKIKEKKIKGRHTRRPRRKSESHLRKTLIMKMMQWQCWPKISRD